MLALLNLSTQNNGLFQDKGKKKNQPSQLNELTPHRKQPTKPYTHPKQQQQILECSQDANEQN